MYRVRVDAVSGKKVYAVGKYLTCIGNARVTVGEQVWTDGRCVYGFHREGDTPIVIVPPEVVEEIIGIPIFAVNGKNTSRLGVSYATYDSEGKFAVLSGAQTNIQEYQSSDLMMWNDDVKAYVWGVQAGSSAPMAINYIDGNEYRIDYEYMPATEDDEEETGFVRVRENANVIFSTEDLYSTIGKAESDAADASLPDFYSPYYPTNLRGGSVTCDANQAFIEDKNKWVFIVSVIVRFYTETDHRGSEDYWEEYREIAQSESVYLYTSDGTQKKIAYVYGKVGETERIYRTYTLLSKRDEFDTAEMRIPMQDGYYYTFNFYPTPPAAAETIRFEYRTIYSPEGKEIYSGYFRAFAYLTIYEMPDGSHLLGVRNPYHTVWILEGGNYAGYTEPANVTEGGLYLVKDKTLSAIYAPKSDSDKGRYHVLNQRLKPVEDYENWTSKISAKS